MRDLVFDRVVSEALLDVVRPGGDFDTLVERRNGSSIIGLDVQLRRDQRGTRSWASLMLGLTNVLDLFEQNGRFWLRAHATHQQAGGFDPVWSTPRLGADLAALREEVQGYLDSILGPGGVDSSHVSREGKVQAAMCSMISTDYGVVQREAAISFASQSLKDGIVVPLATAVTGAVSNVTPDGAPWWPGVRDRGVMPSLGTEADVLALDSTGRLLVIEVKPAEEIKGLAWGPAQVRMYAELFASWLDADEDFARDRLAAMADQRRALGLLDDRWSPASAGQLRVLPVLAIGSGQMSREAMPRITAIAEALSSLNWSSNRVDPFEVWLLDDDGVASDRLILGQSSRASGPPNIGKPGGTSFVAAERASAAAWKASTALLPDAARGPAPYEGRGPSFPFVLPTDHCWLNLLPEAREIARGRFEAAEIRWHSGGTQPSNHLLSSQVQCLNALAPFVDDPGALAGIFESVLRISEVLPFGAATSSPYDATDHVVFEWLGLRSYLNEWPADTPPSRGAYATSADAAIRYRNADGDIEIALIEWKYTERYPEHGQLHGGPQKQATRLGRYRELWADPDSPIRIDAVPYEALFAEPIYQLFRTQLLAWKIEQAHELGAKHVRVVYAAPSPNTDLLDRSLGTPAFEQMAHETGRPLLAAWQSMLRRRDRFVALDTLRLLAPEAPTSDHYRERYGGAARIPEASASDIVNVASGTDLMSMLEHLHGILQRVGGDGGVIAQLIDLGPEALQRLDPSLRIELLARSTEAAELVRRLRADEVFNALHSGPEGFGQ